MRICFVIGTMCAVGTLVSCGKQDHNKNDNPPPVKTEDPSRAPLNQDVDPNTTGGRTTGGTTTGGTTAGGTTTGGTTTGGTTTPQPKTFWDKSLDAFFSGCKQKDISNPRVKCTRADGRPTSTSNFELQRILITQDPTSGLWKVAMTDPSTGVTVTVPVQEKYFQIVQSNSENNVLKWEGRGPSQSIICSENGVSLTTEFDDRICTWSSPSAF